MGWFVWGEGGCLYFFSGVDFLGCFLFLGAWEENYSNSLTTIFFSLMRRSYSTLRLRVTFNSWKTQTTLNNSKNNLSMASFNAWALILLSFAGKSTPSPNYSDLSLIKKKASIMLSYITCAWKACNWKELQLPSVFLISPISNTSLQSHRKVHTGSISLHIDIM